MFASSMDTVRDTTRTAGTMLIPMRFVWPYGGRSVFLSGSFTRWSELVPMTPMEGCPTVFQAIYSLTPGYHQYKFFVDGEWRHDEQQTCTPGEYGIVNTVRLPTEPSYAAPPANPEMTPGSSMDVDNDTFRRLVRINDGWLSEAVHSVSEADLQCSRHRISAFLSTHTVYELLPESGKVVALDIDLPVKQAFHILHEQGIPTAPLWDFSKGQFVGVLSASDFILILKELGKRGSNLTEEELETHTISAWKEGKAYLNGQVDGQGRFLSRQFIHAEPFDNLKDVALKILQNQVATVPIIHSSAEDGSFPQLLHLASLSGILKCICRYFRHCSSLLPVLQLPIFAIPVGTWVPKIGESNRKPLAMLRPSASLSSALNLLIQAQPQLKAAATLTRALRFSPRAFSTSARYLEASVPSGSKQTTEPSAAPVDETKPAEVNQAPNRLGVWSRSQKPRSQAMTGPRFEQTDFDLQPQPKSAMEMIHKEPVRWTHDRIVACEGGAGPAGHPKVFINTDKPEIAICGYCGLPFAHEHHRKHLESLPETSYPLA